MELILTIVFATLFIVPLWRICSRAGFNGALSLLALIPLFGLIIIGAILSFTAWPQKASASKENDHG